MSRSVFLSAVLVLARAGHSAGQDLTSMQNRLDKQIATTRGEAYDLLRDLASFDKDVREAALRVSERPDLIIRLKSLRDATPKESEQVLADLPAEMRTAATVLQRNPQTLDLLDRRLLAASLVGRTYAADPIGVVAQLERINLASAEQAAAATTGWQQRMAVHPQAAAQLAGARSELAGGASAAGTAARGFINGTEARYVLNNADRFPDLAVEVVDQWESDQNPADFREAVDMWYSYHWETLPTDLGGDKAHLAKVLTEQARLERAFSQSGSVGSPSRRAFFQAHEAEYPSLGEVSRAKQFAAAEARVRRIGGAPWVGGSGRGAGGSSSSSRSSMGSTRSSPRASRSSRSNSGGDSVIGFGGVGTSGRTSRSSRNSRNNSSGFGGNSGGFGGGGSGGFGGSGGSGGGFGGGGSGFGGGSTGSSGSRLRNSNSSF